MFSDLVSWYLPWNTLAFLQQPPCPATLILLNLAVPILQRHREEVLRSSHPLHHRHLVTASAKTRKRWQCIDVHFCCLYVKAFSCCVKVHLSDSAVVNFPFLFWWSLQGKWILIIKQQWQSILLPQTSSCIDLNLVAKLAFQYCWLEGGAYREGDVGKQDLGFRDRHVGLVRAERDERRAGVCFSLKMRRLGTFRQTWIWKNGGINSWAISQILN